MLIRSGPSTSSSSTRRRLTPRAEIEGEMGDTTWAPGTADVPGAAQAHATSPRSNTCAIFINQLREKVGVIYGSPEITPAPCLKFYARCASTSAGSRPSRTGADMIRHRTRAKLVKNKCGAPFKVAEVRHHVRQGHQSREGSLLDVSSISGS